MKINSDLIIRLLYSGKGSPLVASAETAVSAIGDPAKKNDGIWHGEEEYDSDERGWDDNSESSRLTRLRDEKQEESNPHR